MIVIWKVLNTEYFLVSGKYKFMFDRSSFKRIAFCQLRTYILEMNTHFRFTPLCCIKKVKNRLDNLSIKFEPRFNN